MLNRPGVFSGDCKDFSDEEMARDWTTRWQYRKAALDYLGFGSFDESAQADLEGCIQNSFHNQSRDRQN